MATFPSFSTLGFYWALKATIFNNGITVDTCAKTYAYKNKTLIRRLLNNLVKLDILVKIHRRDEKGKLNGWEYKFKDAEIQENTDRDDSLMDNIAFKDDKVNYNYVIAEQLLDNPFLSNSAVGTYLRSCNQAVKNINPIKMLSFTSERDFFVDSLELIEQGYWEKDGEDYIVSSKGCCKLPS